MVSDRQFYSIKDHIDLYQIDFTSQYDKLATKLDQYQATFTSQHEEIMTYLHSMLPPPSSQP